jgi:lysophospholipase L1-like esterase
VIQFPSSTRILAVLRRIGRIVGFALAVVASLLVFPDSAPWMVAAWLAAYTLLVALKRKGVLCLVACLGVVIGKRLTPAPGLIALEVIMLSIMLLVLWRARQTKPVTSRKFDRLSLLVLWVAWTAMTFDWYSATRCHHPVLFDPQRPVVCYGDSMTNLGLPGGYPNMLKRLVSLPVHNMGIGGISAKETVESFLPELTRHNPQVVVIEIGGHDFLKGFSRAATKSEMLRIIDAVRKVGAEVVLVEVPRAFVSDPYWGLEREIARQCDVQLVPDTAMRRIFLHSTVFPPGSWLGPPYLTDESGIHPNERGNQILAEYVADALEQMYGPRVRAKVESDEAKSPAH